MATPVRVNISKRDKGGGGAGGLIGGVLGGIGGGILGIPGGPAGIAAGASGGYAGGSAVGSAAGDIIDKPQETQTQIQGDEGAAMARRVQAQQLPDFNERSTVLLDAMHAATELPDEDFTQVAPNLEQAYMKNEYQRIRGMG